MASAEEFHLIITDTVTVDRLGNFNECYSVTVYIINIILPYYYYRTSTSTRIHY
jgi:hypothetical protein